MKIQIKLQSLTTLKQSSGTQRVSHFKHSLNMRALNLNNNKQNLSMQQQKCSKRVKDRISTSTQQFSIKLSCSKEQEVTLKQSVFLIEYKRNFLTISQFTTKEESFINAGEITHLLLKTSVEPFNLMKTMLKPSFTSVLANFIIKISKVLLLTLKMLRNQIVTRRLQLVSMMAQPSATMYKRTLKKPLIISNMQLNRIRKILIS